MKTPVPYTKTEVEALPLDQIERSLSATGQYSIISILWRLVETIKQGPRES